MSIWYFTQKLIYSEDIKTEKKAELLAALQFLESHISRSAYKSHPTLL